MSHAVVKLERGTFNFDRPLGWIDIQMWHFAPIWPGRAKARIDPAELERQLSRAYEKTAHQGLLVLWMPASELHRTPFDPLDNCSHWTAMSTIISGSNPVYIGYIYSKGRNQAANWGCKLILDTEGRKGPSSSLTMKWLLETLMDSEDGFVIDPYAHKSATLAQWCRRLNIPYWGCIRGGKNCEAAKKMLAQVELPGIQQSLL
jgi:hypothetical protein